MKNKKKNHYFIGYMIKFDQQLIDELDKLKRYITSLKEVNTKDIIHNYHTRFLYLGYLDDKTANELIHNKLDSILQAIVNKLNKRSNNLKCEITQEVEVFGHKSTYKKIGIFFKNDIIEKKIVPILREIMKDIYGEYKYEYHPHINIMSIYPLNKYKEELLKSKISYSNISIPESFMFDSIDILKSSTIETRKGKSSKNDESKVELLQTYKIINNTSIVKEKKKKDRGLMQSISRLFRD